MYKVLIVEDEDIIREGLKYMMDWADLGCVVVAEGRNGEEGLQKIAVHQPEIVLIDVNMPIKDGIQMLADCPQLQNFSSIIISGYDEFEYAKKAMEYGVSEYLLKPVNHEELKKAIAKVKREIDQKREFKLLQKSIATPGDIHVLDLETWKENNNNSELVHTMVGYIRENYYEKISIQDLVNSLDMSATYLNRKFKEHTSFTFNEFLNRYRICKAIEMIKAGDQKDKCHCPRGRLQ
ncbi:response regulator [Virgibacillus halophilus]|uniref:Response regulator n=1 Tax=Tigheibacillus halophilus TaxID=361280 RepID=A0ABU5C3R0_9BACI|nr:response regulator [Virgibacillus halophilus]